MPEFHANMPAHEEWKAAVLDGEIELEEIDTEAFAAALRRQGGRGQGLNATGVPDDRDARSAYDLMRAYRV